MATPIPEPLEAGTGQGPAPASDALTYGDRRITLARPGPLGRLAGVAYRRRGRVILGWLAAFALVIGLSAAFAGNFAADYSAPGSDSKQAQDLLAQRFPVQAGDTVDVVVRSDAGVTGPAVRSDVAALLRELGGMPHVAAVEDPYTTPGDTSRDGKTLVSHLKLDVANPVDMPVADSKKLLEAAQAAERPGLDVALGGQTIKAAEPCRRGRLGGQQHAHRPGGRGGRRAGLVDLARRDDGHRHRHRLHAAHGHPVPGVARGRPGPGGRHRRDAGHRRPLGPGRRQYRGGEHAWPVRDGPV